MPYLNNRGYSIYYKEIKSKYHTPILFLHGYLGSVDQHFEKQFQDVSLRNRFYLLGIDIRGFGKSLERNSSNRFQKLLGETISRQDTIGDIKALLDFKNIKKVYLVGYSLGGTLSLEFALKYPTRVQGIIIASSPPFLNKKIRNMPFLQVINPNNLIKKNLRPLATVSSVIWFNLKRKNREFVEEFVKKLCSKRYFTNRWRKIEAIPKLVIYSKKDSVIPQIAFQVYEKHLNNATIKVVDNSDHGFPHEQPHKFNEFVKEFILRSSKTANLEK